MAAVAAALVAGCGFFSVPPEANLTGTWQTDANPTGRGWVLALRTRGDSVLGYGFRLGLEGHVKDSVTVAGRAQGSSVHLVLATRRQGTSTFDGRIVSSTQVAGTLVEPKGVSGSLALHRE